LVWRPPSYHRTAEGTAALYSPISTTSGTSPATLARRLLLTGDTIRAEKLEHLSIFTEVVDDAAVEACAG
jgi:enoyl-CoA hydratase/carnithine racemase